MTRVVAEEYALSEGADSIAIERAINGIIDWLPTIEIERTRLRAALGSVGGSAR